jgi:hypothetical protein
VDRSLEGDMCVLVPGSPLLADGFLEVLKPRTRRNSFQITQLKTLLVLEVKRRRNGIF